MATERTDTHDESSPRRRVLRIGLRDLGVRLREGAPVVGARRGAGWFIAIGMDYYEANDATKTLLLNAIKSR